MSDDYAELIRNEFGGHVDMVMGVSYGGLIAQHFAADHLVIVMSAHKISDAAKQIDMRYAELINQHKDRDAMAIRAEAAFTGIVKHIMGGLLWSERTGQQSKTNQQTSLRNLWSSSTSSRISPGSCARCH